MLKDEVTDVGASEIALIVGGAHNLVIHRRLHFRAERAQIGPCREPDVPSSRVKEPREFRLRFPHISLRQIRGCYGMSLPSVKVVGLIEVAILREKLFNGLNLATAPAVHFHELSALGVIRSEGVGIGGSGIDIAEGLQLGWQKVLTLGLGSGDIEIG